MCGWAVCRLHANTSLMHAMHAMHAMQVRPLPYDAPLQETLEATQRAYEAAVAADPDLAVANEHFEVATAQIKREAAVARHRVAVDQRRSSMVLPPGLGWDDFSYEADDAPCADAAPQCSAAQQAALAAAHAFDAGAEDVGQVMAHMALVGHAREAARAGQHAQQRHLGQGDGGGAVRPLPRRELRAAQRGRADAVARSGGR